MSRRREGSASDKRKKERKKREKRTGALGSFLALVALVARGLVSLGIYSREKNERCQFVVLIEEVIDFFCGDCLGLGIDSERARFKRNVIESTERELTRCSMERGESEIVEKVKSLETRQSTAKGE